MDASSTPSSSRGADLEPRAHPLRLLARLEAVVNTRDRCLARRMLQAWRTAKVITYAGYILGFPADTPESITRDIGIIQRELPVDLLEFFVLTPLPGSKDHQELWRRGVPMDTDMNRYDVEHVTVEHSHMSREAWRDIYERAWELYYSWEHIERSCGAASLVGSGSDGC